MKKTILMLCAGALSLTAAAQSLTTSGMKAGSKMKIEVTSYPLNFEINPKFLSGKQKEKIKAAEAAKSDIASGKIKPKSVNVISYTVIDVKENNGKKQVVLKMDDPSGADYRSMLEFGKDTVYIHRCIGPTPMIDKGDTTGMVYNGTEVLPKTLNVGDRTRGYSDLMVTVPKEGKSSVKMAFANGSGNYSYSGYVTQKFSFTTTSSMITLFQSGTVTAKENISIGSTTVEATVIGTEVWSKFATSIDFRLEQQNYFADPVLNQKILKSNQKFFEQGGKKSEAKIDEISGANEQGYVVKYKEEWYSPEYGVIKTINYDNWGLPQTMTKIISIE